MTIESLIEEAEEELSYWKNRVEEYKNSDRISHKAAESKRDFYQGIVEVLKNDH
jgi:hypothetical protein